MGWFEHAASIEIEGDMKGENWFWGVIGAKRRALLKPTDRR